MNAHKYNYIGVDIGGSHITAASVFLKEQKIGTQKMRINVDSLGDLESIINSWVKAIEPLCADLDHETIKIGIAMPGPFDYQKGISLIKGLHKYEALYGLNIQEILAKELDIPKENFIFRNDAEAFLHGEVVFNNIPATSKTIGVTLGTGLGTAKSIHLKTKDLFKAIEPMHNGIAEDYISTRWFLQRFYQLTGEKLTNVETLMKDESLPFRNQIISEFSQNLGSFLNKFIMDEEADIVVLGGNISKSWNCFKDKTMPYIHKENVCIMQSTLWEEAALIGAACSWLGNDSSVKLNPHRI